MDNKNDFKAWYEAMLQQQMEAEFLRLPEAVTSVYEPVALLRQEQDRCVLRMASKSTGEQVVLSTGRGLYGEALQEEFDVLQRLEHPGIPKALFCTTTDAYTCLLRSWMPGESLAALVRREGPMSFEEALSTLRSLCGILQYLHDQQPPVYGRGLSAEQVVLAPDGTVSLTAFRPTGVELEAGRQEKERAYMHFTVPEQFGHKLDAQVDIYGAGILLLFLITGTPDRARLLEKIPQRRVRSIIQTCTRLDPEKRYPTVKALARAVHRALHPWFPWSGQ